MSSISEINYMDTITVISSSCLSKLRFPWSGVKVENAVWEIQTNPGPFSPRVWLQRRAPSLFRNPAWTDVPVRRYQIQMTPCVAEIISYYRPPVISDLPRHRKQFYWLARHSSSSSIRNSSLWPVIRIAKLISGLQNMVWNVEVGEQNWKVWWL